MIPHVFDPRHGRMPEVCGPTDSDPANPVLQVIPAMTRAGGLYARPSESGRWEGERLPPESFRLVFAIALVEVET